MLIIEKLRYKNFLSSGNIFTEMILNQYETTLIFGSNGDGKSTFIDALTFGLFGKSFRKVNKPLLINSINEKDMLVEVEFRVGNINYLVRRGMKPNIFEIYAKGKLVDQDSKSKDYQSYLEQNILKLNYKTFCQVVVLGSSNYTPFMQLSAADRRFIIEDLLDIQIFSSMNTLLKERISLKKDEFNSIETKIEIQKEKVNIREKYLRELNADNRKKIAENKTKIEDNKKTKKEYLKQIKNIQKNVDQLLKTTSEYDTLKEDISKLTKIQEQAESSIKKYQNEISYYSKTDKCNTCKQGIDEKFRNETITTKTSKIDELKEGLKKVNVKLVSLEQKFETFENTLMEVREKEREISKLNSLVTGIDTFIEKVESEIEHLKNKKSENTEEKESLVELKTILSELLKDKERITEERYQFDVVSMMLKDSGIKTRIIKQYLPIMNKLVNKYLNQMNFFVNFNLDENFKEVIKSHGRDEFSYESFSEGEKTRINLALLFAWRSIARMKNSANTNILIFDEIMDSSLDSEGLDEFIRMVTEVAGNKTNAIIISHRNADNMIDKFGCVLKFTKVKNFSIMTQVN